MFEQTDLLHEWKRYQMCRVASCFNYLIELKQKMLILLEFVTKMLFYEFDNETELFIYRSLQIKIEYQTFLYLMSDQTELENVNSINICYDFFLCNHYN